MKAARGMKASREARDDVRDSNPTATITVAPVAAATSRGTRDAASAVRDASRDAAATFASRQEFPRLTAADARFGHALLHEGGAMQVCTLGDMQVRLQLEVPESAHELKHIDLDGGLDQIENLLFESFEEDDYEAELLLLTATEHSTSRLVGLIFWRELPGKEVAAMLRSEERGCVSDSCGGWVKIELVCTDRTVRGHGIAKLLLAAVLAYEARVRGVPHAVLSVAGGASNTAANSLYAKLGFQVPCSTDGGGNAAPERLTERSDRNLRVVMNVDRSLRAFASEQRYPNVLSAAEPARRKWHALRAALALAKASSQTRAGAAGPALAPHRSFQDPGAVDFLMETSADALKSQAADFGLDLAHICDKHALACALCAHAEAAAADVLADDLASRATIG